MMLSKSRKTAALKSPPVTAPRSVELTVLMPCLNEAETLEVCIKKAQSFLERSDVSGEILIADNGSTDGSQAIADRLGARVISVLERGYGAALQAGILAARGRYVIMGDADDSYDFGDLDSFLAELRKGTHLVMGNRFRGGVMRGAMPLLHKYLGNPSFEFYRTAVLPHSHRGFSLRSARLPGRVHSGPETSDHGNGIRKRDGGPCGDGRIFGQGSANNAAPGRPHADAASQNLARWLAAPQVSSDV